MPNLKDLKIRINSVKSTQKITSAMKMVAASKLKRAQEAAEAARPYARRMARMVASMVEALGGAEGAPRLLVGSGAEDSHLIIVYTSDRGLCGGFNSNIVRAARRKIVELEAAGKTVMIICVGRKARDQLKRDYEGLITETFEGIGKKGIEFSEARDIAERVAGMFEAGEFDVCTAIYNRFVSAMTQEVTVAQLIPVAAEDSENGDETEIEAETEAGDEGGAALAAVYEFEPSEEDILNELLPANLAVQVFHALLESNASEQGARMTAMDNATRNAGDMIDDLTLTYNRTRQAKITTELNEIISGAEAV